MALEKTQQLYFRADAALRGTIDQAAEEDDRTTSDWLRTQYITLLEKRGLLDKKQRKTGRARSFKKADRQGTILYFTAEEDLRDAIRIAALQDGRTRSDWLRFQIKGLLERRGFLPKRSRRKLEKVA